MTLSLVKEKKRIDNTFDVFIGRIIEIEYQLGRHLSCSFCMKDVLRASSCIFNPLVESIIVAHAVTLELFENTFRI